MPASAAACDQRRAHRVRVGVAATRRDRGAGSGTRRRTVIAGQGHLGVDRPGQREVAVGVEPRRRRRTSARARSRRCRRRPWVRPRRARWKAWLWALASPGRTTPGSRSSTAARVPSRSRTSAESMPSSTREADPRPRSPSAARRRSAQYVVIDPVARQVGEHRRSGPRPRPGSRRARRTRPASGRPRWGCGRRSSRSGSPRWRGCRRRARHRCPAAARRSSTRRSRVGQVRVERVSSGSRTLRSPRRRAVGDRRELLDGRGPHGALVGAAGVEPGGDVARDRR